MTEHSFKVILPEDLRMVCKWMTDESNAKKNLFKIISLIILSFNKYKNLVIFTDLKQ